MEVVGSPPPDTFERLKILSPGVVSCGGYGILCSPGDRVLVAAAPRGCDSTSDHPQGTFGGVINVGVL